MSSCQLCFFILHGCFLSGQSVNSDHLASHPPSNDSTTLTCIFSLFRNTSLYYALPLNVEYSHVRMDLLGTDHLSVRFDFNGFCDTKHQFVMTAGTMSRVLDISNPGTIWSFVFLIRSVKSTFRHFPGFDTCNRLKYSV